MGAFSGKILDALRSIAVSLQLSMLIPATLLVVGIAWVIEPTLLTDEAIWVVAFLVITVSYLLNAFNMVIYRTFEGYILMRSAPLRVLRDYQLRQFYEHHHRIYQYQRYIFNIKKLKNDWQFKRKLSDHRKLRLKQWERGWKDRIWHEKERLEERYPPTPDRILPTELGNAIAAFELYPERRYHIDMAHLWPRFVPILLEKKYASFIESEKAIADFFVNLLLVSAIMWPIAFAVFAYTGQSLAGLLFIGLPFSSYIIYRGTCIAAVNWGVTIKAAFDLYRLDLKEALKLKLEDASLDKEREMWQGVSEFLAYSRRDHFGGYDYASKPVEKGPTLPEEGENEAVFI